MIVVDILSITVRHSGFIPLHAQFVPIKSLFFFPLKGKLKKVRSLKCLVKELKLELSSMPELNQRDVTFDLCRDLWTNRHKGQLASWSHARHLCSLIAWDRLRQQHGMPGILLFNFLFFHISTRSFEKHLKIHHDSNMFTSVYVKYIAAAFQQLSFVKPLQKKEKNCNVKTKTIWAITFQETQKITKHDKMSQTTI